MDKPRPFVAVVDDEESVRCALVRLLRASDFDSEGFGSGEEFLASLARRRPDCLVLDLQMAGLSGRDVQKQLIGLQTPIPLIMITAHDEPTIREQSLADGAVAYLRKPLRGDTLIGSVRQAIGDAGARYDQGLMRAPGR
jgi:FixJ family two-component response regulator